MTSTQNADSFSLLDNKTWGNHRLDPYLIWTADINFENLKGRGVLPPSLSFVAELSGPYQPTSEDAQIHNFSYRAPLNLLSEIRPPTGMLVNFGGRGNVFNDNVTLGSLRELPDEHPAVVPFLYETKFPNDQSRPSFVTLRIALNPGLNEEQGWETIKLWINQLMCNEHILRLQLGFNRNPSLQASLHSPPGSTLDDASQASPSSEPPKVVIGIVDDAGLFAHGAFRNAHSQGAGTRVWRYWNQSYYDGEQSMKVVAPWEVPRKPETQLATDALYGRELTQSSMNMLIRRYQAGDFVDEESLYGSLALTERIQLRESHAALVAPLACGQGRAIPMKDDMLGGVSPIPSDDSAGQAPLVFVQLPREVVHVTNGRAVAVNALDGIQYVMQKTRELVGDKADLPPVVINLSLGAVAGPHDGTSIFERAMDQLVNGYQDRLAIVLAAGNSHGTKRKVDDNLGYLASGVHAKAMLVAGGSAQFALYVPPDKQFETYMELWIDADVDLKEVRVSVLPPTGGEKTVHLNERALWEFAQNETKRPMGGVYFIKNPVQSTKNRSMVLVVLAATQPASTKVHAPSGLWMVKIEGPHSKDQACKPNWQTHVEVWVERDDRLTGIRRPQSARLIEYAGCVSPTDDNAVTSLGSGELTFNVGALNAHGDTSGTPRVSAYSAEATKDNMIDFSAVADAGMALPGIRVAGNRSGVVLRANGTSLAAPQAARWIANQLSGTAGAPKTLADIRQAIASDPNRTTRVGKVIP